ncbi:DNA polymerase-3 subunit gamma/tau [Anaerobacterium chartisolvens]|uniref:DNA-directed DNA polymerase n=1 Tax=Anaerobacterium chartisolvens TaxID=1297424 RepID=A0A369B9S1_9FIRM|nr:DNA polymerase III subunit gamma/tau [Anaerobacterium chartisolvens]RCX18270.1 DNA polymerase-3 subunit gamma/tau [Anaerobacterium chartisolvens]
MSYIALYRKWRPAVFEDVVEQEHVVKTLKHSVSKGRIAHAYLFCGTRGTGKTTMAKIFSRAINCLSPHDGDPCNQCEICKGILSENILDVIEIDAASNNSVDNVRSIRDEVIYAPSQAKYKVYIIDEVHMLSTGAFNALLKTLEEPPPHVVFILATTDPHKLPATILSRCQRFDFKRISIDSIVERIMKISRESDVELHKDAARLIAKTADGALRDAISLLDQCIGLGNSTISYEDVLSVAGISNDMFTADMLDAVIQRDISKILELVDILIMEGKDISQFVSGLVYYYRNVLICKMASNPRDIVDASEDSIKRMLLQQKELSKEKIMMAIKELSAVESSLKWVSSPRILLEVSLMKLCDPALNKGDDSVLERLAELEKRAAGAASVPSPQLKPDTEFKSSSPKDSKKVPSGQAASHAEAKPAEKPLLKHIAEWEAVINELKSSGRMVLYSNLIGTKALVLDNRFIGIVFGADKGFCKMVAAKAENLEIIEAAASKKLGREVKIKCLSEGDVQTNTGQEQDAPPEDELMATARELASKANVPLNVIDE